MIGLAPAIGNAIFDATGVRLRALPMVPDGLKPA
jgi:CO/xanthine dehydrogenase Mo-binding subunit